MAERTVTMKLGDRVPLSCGHRGRVIWIRDDGKKMAVRGSSYSCAVCGKNSKGSRTQTVYLMDT
jgi:hypothetical protein